MENIEFKQMVMLDYDTPKMVEQSATFDPDDKWVHLVHDAGEISLSLENWNKLKEIADKATETELDLEQIVNLAINWLKENKKDDHQIIISSKTANLLRPDTEWI